MVKKLFLIILSTFLFFISSPTTALAGISRIWSVDDSEKIKKDDISNSLATSSNNPVWNGNQISLFGAKNEIVAFQLIIQADGSGINNVNVKVSDLTNGLSKIPNSDTGSTDPFNYRDKNIELFKEHYLKVTKRTQSGIDWAWYSPAATPSDYYSGWVPDALIPLTSSFNIEANKNQGIWADIWIPPTALTGKYQGNINILVNNSVYQTIPLELFVYDFALPDQQHLRNIFAIERNDIAKRHGLTSDTPAYYSLEQKYHQMAHRHRFNIATFVDEFTKLDTYHKPYLNGSLYTPDQKYSGPGQSVGNNTFVIGLYGNLPEKYRKADGTTSESYWRDGSNAWESWFRANAPNTFRFKYLNPDEPGACSDITACYSEIKQQANWTHNNPGVGQSLPGFVTSHVVSDLQGYVDIWCYGGTPTFDFSLIAAEQLAGRKFGIYNGYRPRTGSMIIDTDATDPRVNPWIIWKNNFNLYFYWMTTFWTDTADNTNTDIFTDPLTFDNRANGDGTFFYPGTDVIGSVNYHLNGPIASIRMKNWRRGAQDYEYLLLAKNKGINVDGVVQSIMPLTLANTSIYEQAKWPSHGYVFEAQRQQLANMITASSSPTPSSCLLASSGDFNCDDLINESDLNTLLGKWMTNVNDITGDGKVNESDLNILLGNWKTL
ncbi:DUF4091 domain-containing protein [Candidatus Microgenomates bacterium]|nr:DUF4091 domain-containing protein [Candidatus Microgenomates bacterium]